MSSEAGSTSPRASNDPDLRVRLSLLSRAEGGRTKPVTRHYQPHFSIRRGYLTSGKLMDVRPDPMLAGDTGIAEVRLLTPEAYPGTLWLGLVLSVREAERRVGTATVLAIHNPLLVAERLPSEWSSEPPVFTTVEAALRALVADPPEVRIAAYRYLAGAGEDWALEAHVEDPDPNVRAAVRALRS